MLAESRCTDGEVTASCVQLRLSQLIPLAGRPLHEAGLGATYGLDRKSPRYRSRVPRLHRPMFIPHCSGLHSDYSRVYRDFCFSPRVLLLTAVHLIFCGAKRVRFL